MSQKHTPSCKYHGKRSPLLSASANEPQQAHEFVGSSSVLWKAQRFEASAYCYLDVWSDILGVFILTASTGPDFRSDEASRL